MRRLLLLAALGLGLAVGAYLVLDPEGSVPSTAVGGVTRTLLGAGVPGWVADGDVVQFVLNVALFVPPVFVAATIWRRLPWWGWAGLGLLLSGAIEVTQGLFLADRTPQVADLVSNTLGAAVGAGASRVHLRRRSRLHP